LKRLEIDASEFLMVGNSLKSDVLPVLGMSSYAIHIPFHTTWL
jgi:putative hydrolase of the HAD superfamily